MSDEITTIFVVGFPDDMREREFQNMFTFSPGFEAATLKVPVAVPLDDTERDSSSIQKKQIVSTLPFFFVKLFLLVFLWRKGINAVIYPLLLPLPFLGSKQPGPQNNKKAPWDVLLLKDVLESL